MTQPLTVALLAFDGVDLLDLGGPYEVFLTANRLAARDERPPPFQVVTVTLDGKPCEAYGGLVLAPGASLREVGEEAVLVVPGLVDYPTALDDNDLVTAIAAAGRASRMVASVCTGAFLLAAAGLLEGVPATTHFEDVPVLATMIGEESALEARWVDAGRIVTAGGLSNGIAMALHLVQRLDSLQLAERTARQIEYRWDPGDGITVTREPPAG